MHSLIELLERMRAEGVARFYAKRLSPNDNSKNQVYLGGGFGVLNILPHAEILPDRTETAGSVREREKAGLDFCWIDSDGLWPAPNAQLILYPRYPEVRMSGFLLGCAQPPSGLMTSREEGRVLFLGVMRNGRILGYVAPADSGVVRELEAADIRETAGVFLDLTAFAYGVGDTTSLLISALREVREMGWISSRRLGRGGAMEPYSARNGGGYTLEALLGVSPNGNAEPDYLGWEVKQYGVHDFSAGRAKSPVTLMTPEPTGGLYRDQGPAAFLHRYGYPDQSGKPDRINFGGIYRAGNDFHPETGLALALYGFDPDSGRIMDMDGGIVLSDSAGEVAAFWGFAGLMNHWNRKHARAVYVPSLFRTPPPEYAYGNLVQLCVETDFLLFLGAMAAGQVYYDPGIKLENASTARPEIKRRSQFRVSHMDLGGLYRNSTTIDVVSGCSV